MKHATGININGNIQQFFINNDNEIHAVCANLISINLTNDIKKAYIYNNKLTELKLSNSLIYVNCSRNRLTKLIIPNGFKKIFCWDNNIKQYSLILPESIKEAGCDKHTLDNINKYKHKDISIYY